MSLKELLKKLEDDEDFTATYRHGEVEQVELYRKGTSRCLVGFSLQSDIYLIGSITILEPEDGVHLSTLLKSEYTEVSVRGIYDKKKGRFNVNELVALGPIFVEELEKREGIYIDEHGDLKRIEVKER